MLSCRTLEKSNNPYIESLEEPCVSKNQKGIFAMSIWLERKFWKIAETVENSIPEMRAKFMCMCVLKKQFWISCDHFKVYKKSKSPIQKGF